MRRVEVRPWEISSLTVYSFHKLMLICIFSLGNSNRLYKCTWNGSSFIVRFYGSYLTGDGRRQHTHTWIYHPLYNLIWFQPCLPPSGNKYKPLSESCEAVVVHKLGELQLGPPVLGFFAGGRVEKYLPVSDLVDPLLMQIILHVHPFISLAVWPTMNTERNVLPKCWLINWLWFINCECRCRNNRKTFYSIKCSNCWRRWGMANICERFRTAFNRSMVTKSTPCWNLISNPWSTPWLRIIDRCNRELCSRTMI